MLCLWEETLLAKISAQIVNLYEGILAIPIERILEACGI